MQKFDLLICSIPSIELYLPPAAPATLKGFLKTKGFSCHCVDLNLLMHNEQPDQFNDLNSYFVNENSKVTPELQSAWNKTMSLWTDALDQYQFTWLGISVFSIDSRRATLDLLDRYRTRNFKIVVGGMGVTVDFGYDLLKKGLIDAYIVGEGEHALVNLLQGNTDYPGINSPGVQIENLDDLGFADYTDYQLAEYTGFYSEPVVQITGSRGCVRACTFCDISDHWPKFKFRSGQHIADEIIKTYETQGIKNFYFTDSLINGSMSAYMRMCETLAHYNSKHQAGITWGGQYIVRTSKELPQDYYSLTSASGAFNLAVGVETGSDQVRNHMKKKFSNYDLDLTMENFSKHRITCSFLIIIGYPTETTEDFYETLRMFKRYQLYAAQGIILGVSLGTTMIALEQSPVFKMFKDTTTYQNQSSTTSWIIDQNPELDYKARVHRRLQAELVLDYLGYNLISSDRNLNQIARELSVFNS